MSLELRVANVEVFTNYSSSVEFRPETYDRDREHFPIGHADLIVGLSTIHKQQALVRCQVPTRIRRETRCYANNCGTELQTGDHVAAPQGPPKVCTRPSLGTATFSLGPQVGFSARLPGRSRQFNGDINLGSWSQSSNEHFARVEKSFGGGASLFDPKWVRYFLGTTRLGNCSH
jgi:hypothetical protein